MKEVDPIHLVKIEAKTHLEDVEEEEEVFQEREGMTNPMLNIIIVINMRFVLDVVHDLVLYGATGRKKT